jgi:hypothetical protein
MIYDNVFRDQVLVLLPREPGSTDLFEHYYNLKQYDPRVRAHDKQCLSLLRVSRQLYREVALVPYQLVTFDFYCNTSFYPSPLDVLGKFLVNRSWAQVSTLQRLRCIHYTSSDPWEIGCEKTETGLFWMAYSDLKQSDLALHRTVV